jgi:hypothetical protein
MQGILPILTLFLAPFSLSIPIKSFICPGFMFIQQALLIYSIFQYPPAAICALFFVEFS